MGRWILFGMDTNRLDEDNMDKWMKWSEVDGDEIKYVRTKSDGFNTSPSHRPNLCWLQQFLYSLLKNVMGCVWEIDLWPILQ